MNLTIFLPISLTAKTKRSRQYITETHFKDWRCGQTKIQLPLFGAWGPCKSGTEEVTRISKWVASRFSNCTEYNFEVVAAGVSGDLAYTVGYEHSLRSLDGGPVENATLRVTHIYRKENGEWKIVHRHGDALPFDQSPPVKVW